MAKRFVDTDLWQKQWFQELSVKEKILVKYIFENCDCAGVWDINLRMASFVIGETITLTDFYNINNKKELFRFIKDEQDHEKRIFVIDYITFQYGNLSYNCKPHLPVIKLLQKYGIDFETIDEDNLTIKQQRKRLTNAAKEKIFIRDKYECQYCGSKEDLEVDHIIPLSKGGNNEDDNLITACHTCNKLKSDKSLKEFVENGLCKNLDRVSKILDTLEEKEKEKEIEKEMEKEKDKEKEINDPYVNPYVNIFKKEYKKNFNARLYLTAQERTKIIELASDIEDFKDTIPIVIEKLKNIDFGFENFTPNVNWLLKDSNYTAVLNGTYDKQETAEEKILRRLRERSTSG